MNSARKTLSWAWWVLRITYGTLFILVGVDKFFNLLTNWQQFIGATAHQFLPIASDLLLKIFGLIQICAGILLFTRWIWIGIYIISILLMIIFINLFSAPTSALVIGHDLAMITGMIVFWQLSTIMVVNKERFMNITQAAYDKIKQSWWLLKLTYGLLFVIAGADKFMNWVVNWQQYISPMILKMIPVTSQQFIWGVGIVEIFIGVLILAIATRLGAYLAMTWLLLIVVNLLSMGTYFDIAVRDTVMAIGALVLAILTEAHQEMQK